MTLTTEPGQGAEYPDMPSLSDLEKNSKTRNTRVFMVEIADVSAPEVQLGDWLTSTLAVTSIARAQHNNEDAIRFTLKDESGGPAVDTQPEAGRLVLLANKRVSVTRFITVEELVMPGAVPRDERDPEIRKEIGKMLNRVPAHITVVMEV